MVLKEHGRDENVSFPRTKAVSGGGRRAHGHTAGRGVVRRRGGAAGGWRGCVCREETPRDSHGSGDRRSQVHAGTICERVSVDGESSAPACRAVSWPVLPPRRDGALPHDGAHGHQPG